MFNACLNEPSQNKSLMADEGVMVPGWCLIMVDGSWLMADPGMVAWGLLMAWTASIAWLSGPVRPRRCSWPLD